MNKERLQILKDTIIKNESNFVYKLGLGIPIDQCTWEYRSGNVTDEYVEIVDRSPACGTVACAAGWTVKLFSDPTWVPISWVDIETTARLLLDLTHDQASFLFMLMERFGFESIQLKNGTAKDAIERIDYLLS
jgi:hypothetical protein